LLGKDIFRSEIQPKLDDNAGSHRRLCKRNSWKRTKTDNTEEERVIALAIHGSGDYRKKPGKELQA
jgi:hypothetical protein